jgi:hypothetical protein
MKYKEHESEKTVVTLTGFYCCHAERAVVIRFGFNCFFIREENGQQAFTYLNQKRRWGVKWIEPKQLKECKRRYLNRHKEPEKWEYYLETKERVEAIKLEKERLSKLPVIEMQIWREDGKYLGASEGRTYEECVVNLIQTKGIAAYYSEIHEYESVEAYRNEPYKWKSAGHRLLPYKK